MRIALGQLFARIMCFVERFWGKYVSGVNDDFDSRINSLWHMEVIKIQINHQIMPFVNENECPYQQA